MPQTSVYVDFIEKYEIKQTNNYSIYQENSGKLTF